MLWENRIASFDEHDSKLDALRALNTKIYKDTRVRSSLLRVGDGTLLVFKI